MERLGCKESVDRREPMPWRLIPQVFGSVSGATNSSGVSRSRERCGRIFEVQHPTGVLFFPSGQVGKTLEISHMRIKMFTLFRRGQIYYANKVNLGIVRLATTGTKQLT